MSVNVAQVTRATATEREVRSDMEMRDRRMAGFNSAINPAILPSCLPAISSSLQVQRTERRKHQSQRLVEAVRGDGLRVDAAKIPNITAAVQLAVAVERFAVPAWLGHADSVTSARHGCEVENHDEEIPPVLPVADHGDDAVLVVVAVDPAEPVGREVALVEGRLRAVLRVQIMNETLERRVGGILEQVPVEAQIVVPFAPLPELAAHEQQLLAGM